MLVRASVLRVVHSSTGTTAGGAFSGGHVRFCMPHSASGSAAKVLRLSRTDPSHPSEHSAEFVFSHDRSLLLLQIGLFEADEAEDPHHRSHPAAAGPALIGSADHPLRIHFDDDDQNNNTSTTCVDVVPLFHHSSNQQILIPTAHLIVQCEVVVVRQSRSASPTLISPERTVGCQTAEELRSIRGAIVASLVGELSVHRWAHTVSRQMLHRRPSQEQQWLIGAVILVLLWWGQWLALLLPTAIAYMLARTQQQSTDPSSGVLTVEGELETLHSVLRILRGARGAAQSLKVLWGEVSGWAPWAVAVWWLAALFYPDFVWAVQLNFLVGWAVVSAAALVLLPDAPSLMTPSGLLFLLRKVQGNNKPSAASPVPHSSSSPHHHHRNEDYHHHLPSCFLAITIIRAKVFGGVKHHHTDRGDAAASYQYALRGPHCAWPSDGGAQTQHRRHNISPDGTIDFCETFRFDADACEAEGGKGKLLTFELNRYTKGDEMELFATTTISADFALRQCTDCFSVPLDSPRDASAVVGEIDVLAVTLTQPQPPAQQPALLSCRRCLSDVPSGPFRATLEVVSIQFAGAFASSVGYGAHCLRFSCGAQICKSPAVELREAKLLWCELTFPLVGVQVPFELQVELHDVRCRDSVASGRAVVESCGRVVLWLMPVDHVIGGAAVGELVCCLSREEEEDH